ncbi:putative receptor-like protein kinase [Sesamum alatum]|uniref:Receptor-like protein kinase n=1 Tax=Sesamum alatum TaxID=300844 RepID=A0AAE1Z2L5_9LAMI|nr:putative receptor-like protein kinase [Sesamum alatum]
MFGLIEMNEFVEELGYDKQKVRLWHQFGHSLHLGSVCLETNTDVYGIINHLQKSRVVEIYLEHLDEPEIDLSFLDNINLSDPDPIPSHSKFDGEVGQGNSVDNQILSEEMQNMIEGEHSEGGADIRSCSCRRWDLTVYFNWKIGDTMDPYFRSELKYESLEKITNSFGDENYIGRFLFGKIYHGIIDRGWGGLGRSGTVKIWDKSISTNDLTFMREVTLLRNEMVKCQPGVVELLGYVCDGEHLVLLYDFKTLTTLCSQLHQDDFNWLLRIKVALCLARTVKFFHSQNPPFGPFVIHNIDANHILLDEDYIPKLFDFSLMTGGGPFPKEPHDENEPPCQNSGGKDDIFAFGLLLLSLTSKQIISKSETMGSLIPHGSEWNLSEVESGGSLIGNEKVCLSLVHGSFEAEPYFYATDGQEILRVVMQCMHPSPDERPSMKQIVARLQKLQVVQNHGDLVVVKPKDRPKYRPKYQL